jgi:uncharacterized protein
VVSAYFLDSSALVKRYVSEIGSEWIQGICNPQTGNHTIIARITWVEVLSAFARLQREGKLNSTDFATAIRIFRHDLDMQYQLVEIDQTLTFTAGQLLQQYPLRAYDSIQLAAVIRLKPAFAQLKLASLTFISADIRLLAVAQAEGIVIDNPNLHP